MSYFSTPILSFNQAASRKRAEAFEMKLINTLDMSSFNEENIPNKKDAPADTVFRTKKGQGKSSTATMSLESLFKFPSAPPLPGLEREDEANSFVTPSSSHSSCRHSLKPRKRSSLEQHMARKQARRMEPPKLNPGASSSKSVIMDDCLPDKLLCPDLPSDDESDEREEDMEETFWRETRTPGRIPFRPCGLYVSNSNNGL